MRSIIILSLFCILFVFSCEVKESQETSNFNIEQYFQNIENADTCLGEGEPFQALGNKISKVLKEPLDTLKSTSALKKLYYAAVEREKVAKPRTNPRCIDVNVGVKSYTLTTMGNLGTEDAMKVLLSIYKDKNLTFLGSHSKDMINALAKQGEPILNKIEAIKKERPIISQKVIQLIQSGQPIN